MEIQIDGLNCPHCAKKVETAVKSIIDGKVEINGSTVHIPEQSEESVREIYAAIENAGFSVHKK